MHYIEWSPRGRAGGAEGDVGRDDLRILEQSVNRVRLYEFIKNVDFIFSLKNMYEKGTLKWWLTQ